MKITEIIRLHSLGYTKDEVRALMEQEKEPVQEVVGEVVQPEPEQEHEAPSNEVITDAVQNNNTDAILTAINGLTKAIQASNLLHDRQEPVKTTEDVLNEFLKGV